MSNPIISDATPGEAGPTPYERRALVVEDDDPIRSLIDHVLRRDGYRVDTAVNGQEALELMTHHQYDVILLDLAMPVMDGVELLEHLERRMPPALRRVVVMTASLHLLRPGLPEGVCRVITKPFAVEELRAAIDDCVPAVDR